jgi:hypothetical protein
MPARLESSLLVAVVALALGQGCGKPKPSSGAITEDDGAAGTGTAGAAGAGTAGGAAGGGATAGGSGSGQAGGSSQVDATGSGGGDAMIDMGHEPDPIGPVVDCSRDPERCAFCTGKYATVTINEPVAMRGTWQFNPGGPSVTLADPGFPCSAFLHDGSVRPSLDDDHWVGATNGATIDYSTSSTLTTTDYRSAQFSYFRTMVFLPASLSVDSFRVLISGVDDSVRVMLYNSKYPQGISPSDAGASDPDVGACAGYMDAAWDLKSYVQVGEVNVVEVIQVDLRPTVSALNKGDVTVNGAELPLYDCVNGIPPNLDAGAD